MNDLIELLEDMKDHCSYMAYSLSTGGAYLPTAWQDYLIYEKRTYAIRLAIRVLVKLKSLREVKDEETLWLEAKRRKDKKPLSWLDNLAGSACMGPTQETAAEARQCLTDSSRLGWLRRRYWQGETKTQLKENPFYTQE